MSTSELTPNIMPAFNLVRSGLKLVKLHRFEKRPIGENWQSNADNFATMANFDHKATGYGLPLAINGLVSLDPDNVELAAVGLRALGFDLEELMSAGVRTTSTRPKSGGRSTFADPKGLRWLKFSSAETGTVLELRATSSNLQDVVAGAVYRSKDGEHYYQQDYANGKTHADAKDTHLPKEFEAWWRRCSVDVDFLREQQRLFFDAIGVKPHLAVSSGLVDGKATLAFKSPHRGEYNRTHCVEEILERNNYSLSVDGRYAPPTATGAPAVRPIPNKNGLWQSDHASDPLHGTFDAWIAHVQLDHEGDLDAAEAEAAVSGFVTFPALDDHSPPINVPDSGFIVSAAEFAAQAESPHFLVERMLQKGLVYSCTAKWGHGKTAVLLTLAVHVARGFPFAGLRTVRSKVLFMAGENPADVRLRFLGVCKHYGLDPQDVEQNLMFTTRSFSIDNAGACKVHADAIKAHGEFDVVFIDTLPTHSSLDDDNSNSQQLALAKSVRDFGRSIDSNPALIAMMHPPQTATKQTLRSRGGGAFAGEIDAELLMWLENGVVEVFHSTKFRGAGFKPFHLALSSVELPEFVDNFGNVTRTVVAEPTAAPPPPKDLSPAGQAVYAAFITALDQQPIGNGESCAVSGSELREIFDKQEKENDPNTKENSVSQKFKRGVEDAVKKRRLFKIGDSYVTVSPDALLL